MKVKKLLFQGHTLRIDKMMNEGSEVQSRKSRFRPVI